ncbi:PDZ domain-containing protein [Streptomyces sp. NPDC005438]|uniref:YlbL family protein n=1 Tax=Streptomyces sp. NPDC005438 TaxID=3156880 RepID=UPI0033A6F9FB
MPRRTATMLTSTLVLIVLIAAALLIKVPYAEMSPGPTVNTLGKHGGEPVLSFPGRDDKRINSTTGNLNMTTVSVTPADYRMHLVEAVAGWLAHDDVVVPYETLYPDDRSASEVDKQNAEEFSQSQESAKVAALRQVGEKVRARVVVSSVVKDSPSQGKLHAGDVIRAVDGQRVNQPQDVRRLVTKHRPGQQVRFTVVPVSKAKAAEKAGKEPPRGDESRVTVRTAPAPDDRKRAMVGIESGVDHTFPFPIKIKLADVGGPSAGLMFALGIVDKLQKTDLTGGAFVAGTGTIDDEGKVGAIGGIRMKTIAARKAGARYFLTPEDNCATAAKGKPGGLTLVKVDTIEDALDALKGIRDKDSSAIPKCGG